MKNRESFVFYRSFYEALQDLDNETRLKLYDAIADYSLNLEEPKMSGIEGTIFKLIKPQIEANNKRYLNGSKPKQKQNRSKTEAKQKQTESKTETNVNDNVNVNDNDNVKGKAQKGSRLENLPDSKKEELKKFMIEHCDKNNISREEIAKFADYWKSVAGAKGVKIDWKATFRNWCRSDWVKKKTNKPDKKRNELL